MIRFTRAASGRIPAVPGQPRASTGDLLHQGGLWPDTCCTWTTRASAGDPVHQGGQRPDTCCTWTTRASAGDPVKLALRSGISSPRRASQLASEARQPRDSKIISVRLYLVAFLQSQHRLDERGQVPAGVMCAIKSALPAAAVFRLSPSKNRN